MLDNKSEIIKLKKFDPLAHAEELTGVSYKEDEGTMSIGFGFQLLKSERMNKLMESTDDTKFSETTEEYIRKIESAGFKSVYSEPFVGEDDSQECLYIFWHDDLSILLIMDTFRGNRNSAKMYYNFSPNDGAEDWSSSGSYHGFYWKSDFSEELPNPNGKMPGWGEPGRSEWLEGDEKYRSNNKLRKLWVGDHDAREGIKNTISHMLECGVFLREWKSQPFLWILHHMDTKSDSYDYKSINKRRMSLLPEEVIKKITP